MRLLYRAGVTAMALVAVGSVLVEPLAAQPASDDDLAQFEQLLQNPNGVSANIAYAYRLQELGRPDDAAMVYRRVLSIDPNNATALAALGPVGSSVVPQAAQTDFTLRVGGAYETNSPRRPPTFRSFDDAVGFAEFTVNDTRRLGNVTLQSNFDAYSNFHNRYTPGDISYFSVDTGPVLNLDAAGKLRIAIGGEYVLQGPSPIPADAHHSRQFEFDAGNLILNYFPPVKMPLQSVNLLVGYNNFRNSEAARNGAVMRLTAPMVFDEAVPGLHTQLLATPGFIYNGAEEATRTLQPAHYSEVNLNLLTLTPIAEHQLGAERVVAKLGTFLDGQFYEHHDVLSTGNRRDFRVIPVAGIRLLKFLSTPMQLDLDYRYDRNFSNEAAQRFEDHIVSLTATIRF